jgi:flagellar motility protein MotE (MotC chaperone)
MLTAAVALLALTLELGLPGFSGLSSASDEPDPASEVSGPGASLASLLDLAAAEPGAGPGPPAAEAPPAEPDAAVPPPADPPPVTCPTSVVGLEDVATDLIRRRQALVGREDQLRVREAGLAEAARLLQQEARRLQELRGQLDGQIVRLSEADQARVAQLIKMYETMKPKDAAQVFNGLDMKLLVQVLGGMREAKAAVIMAAMDPDRTREVTTELARRRTQAPEPAADAPNG